MKGTRTKLMEPYCDEPALADLLSDPVTLAVMHADGVDPRELAAVLTRLATKLRSSSDRISRPADVAIDASLSADRNRGIATQVAAGWDASIMRHHLRLVSGLILLAFVVCHLTAHSFLLISFQRADAALDIFMYPWRTFVGTGILVWALLIHYLNALWSIYVRRYLRLSRWERWQLALGLCIPLLIMLHVIGTRIAESALGIKSHYSSVLLLQWQLSPWLGLLQVAAVMAVWVHASIGLHFWLRTKAWYPRWRVSFASVGLLMPTLALSGYVTAGNQVLRAAVDPHYVRASLEQASLTDEKRAQINTMASTASLAYVALALLPFAGRSVRGWYYRRRRPPMLTHSSGRAFPILPGATVLEVLRENGIPHASVCGGRARCTTCRVLVTKGLDRLPEPSELERRALARFGARPGMRLACQICPISDISVVPLLPPDAGPADGRLRGGLEGSEQSITVLFVDLRRSTMLGEGKMPYDLLFILNQFFHEMTKALDATGGHYAEFSGDGLMALYGLNTRDPASGIADALHGAREMLARTDQLNRRLKGDLRQPLRIGIGIHFGEAVVGAMGPPGSQVITAIGDTVNTCARLERLTKQYDCLVILSRQTAEMAGLDPTGRDLQCARVNGLAQPVEFYALQGLADLRI